MSDIVFWPLMLFATSVALVLLLLIGMTVIRRQMEERKATAAQDRRIIEQREKLNGLRRDIQFSSGAASR